MNSLMKDFPITGLFSLLLCIRDEVVFLPRWQNSFLTDNIRGVSQCNLHRFFLQPMIFVKDLIKRHAIGHTPTIMKMGIRVPLIHGSP